MNITVTKNQVSVDTDYILNDKEYNVNQCYFTFSDEYTDNLVKKAIFVQGTSTIEMSIINNQCQIPEEVLNNGQFQLRVYAYEVDGDELSLRYSPSYTTAYVRTGSYIENAESPEVITPTQFEQYMQAMNDGLNEVANVDIDAEQTSTGGTVTITNRYGEEKTVEIKDGEKGETGATPNIQIGTVVTGDHSEVTRTGTNENPIFNFVLEKGDKGDTGNGIASVTKTSTSGLVDTYTITYTNGTTTDFDVTNGKSITNIAKTSTSGLEDTYTITYNDNTTSTFTVENGNGISSIEKTGTQNNVDTYTIYYTNGTTSTFTVTNSTVTNQEFEELKAEHEELVNTLPRVEGTGESITLDNTAQYKMNVALSGNTSQVSYTGKNLFGSHCNLLYKNTGTWTNDGASVTGSTTSGGYALYDLGLLSDYVGKTLTFSFSNTPATTYGLTAFVMCENDGSNRETVSGSTLGTNSSLTVTIPSGYAQTRLAIRLYLSNVSSGTFNNIQIEQGDAATSYEPYVGGIPSPNPLYPQDIHVVSGNNEVKVSNRNMFDSNNLTSLSVYRSSYSSLSTGVRMSIAQASAYTMAVFKIGLTKDLVGKKLRFSSLITPSGNNNGRYVLCYCNATGGDRTTIVFGITSGGTISATIQEGDGDYVGLILYSNYSTAASSVSVGDYIDYTNIILTIDNENVNYIPHQSQTYPINLGSLEYCKIGNYSDEFALSTGSNKFNTLNSSSVDDGVTTEIIDNNDVVIKYNGTSANYKRARFIINNLKQNTNYLFKAHIVNSNSNITSNWLLIRNNADTSNIINTSYTSDSVINFNSGDNTSVTFVLYVLGSTSATSNNATWSNIQLNENDIKDYEPYGIGNWYIRKNIGKVVLDGTEDWIYASSSVWKFRVSVSNLINNSTGSTQYWFYSNYYKAENGDNYGVGQVNNNTRIGFKNTDIATLEDFKTWLSIHNTTVYYPLQTPTSEAITDTTLIEQLNNLYNQIKSYKGQTNITQTNAKLPFNIDASALYDLNNLISRVATLEVEV